MIPVTTTASACPASPTITPGADARVCNEKPDLLPLFAPDLNAVYYDTLTALGDMAKALNKPEEASRWYTDANCLADHAGYRVL